MKAHSVVIRSALFCIWFMLRKPLFVDPCHLFTNRSFIGITSESIAIVKLLIAARELRHLNKIQWYLTASKSNTIWIIWIIIAIHFMYGCIQEWCTCSATFCYLSNGQISAKQSLEIYGGKNKQYQGILFGIASFYGGNGLWYQCCPLSLALA